MSDFSPGDRGPSDPPRIPEWFLRQVLPAGIVREDVVGSLAAEYDSRVRRDGIRRAGRWYRRQVWGIVARRGWAVLSPAGSPAHVADVARQVRVAVRRLARAPGFAMAVVLTLVLGVGATTAVFGIVYGVLIQPLPFPDPDRLVWMRNAAPDREWSFSMADYLALEEQQSAFTRVGAYDPAGVILSTAEGSERLQAHRVTSGLLPLMGLEPALGRGITEQDTRPGADPVALLSWGTWLSRFGGDRAVVGRTVTLDQRPTTVVGVLPARVGPIIEDRDLILPLTLEPPSRKGPFFLYVIGHLREGTTHAAASTELAGISERIFPIWQGSFPDAEVRWIMHDLKEALLGEVDAALWIALAAVASLLLIALTNATNLMVARVARQEREVAVRAALGAAWPRLLVNRLAESAVLSVLGCAGGLALAWGGLRAVRAYGGGFIPRMSEIALAGPVLLFLLGVAALAALLLAVIPALQVRGRLRSGALTGGRVVGSLEERGLRRGLVVAQLAVSVPLLVAAALLLSSLRSLSRAEPGFDPEGLLTMQLTLPSGVYDGEAAGELWQRLLADIRALPGVAAAGMGNGRPPADPGFGNNFLLEDVPLPPGAAQHSVPWTVVDPSYFDVLGVDLLAGDMFDGSADSLRIALVDETWARRFFGTPEAAVGRRFLHGGCTDPGDCPWWTVTGVVGDVEYNGAAEADEGAMYLAAALVSLGSPFILIRAEATRAITILPAVRSIVSDLDPRIPVTDVATGPELMSDSIRFDRYLTVLVAVFGTVALVLSLVGMYGVLSHYVERNRRDIGVRLALGGEPRRVAAMVLRTAMGLVVTGAGVGAVAAVGLSGFLRRMLFEVDPWDPTVFTAVLAGLGLTALLVCWGPAARAARLDPAGTLKEE